MSHIDGKISEEIAQKTGWTPPVIYDVATDETRLATQQDVDRLLLVERAYAEIANYVRQQHERLRAELERFKKGF